MDDIKPPDFKGPDLSKIDDQRLETPGPQATTPIEHMNPGDVEGAQLKAQLSRADLNDPVRCEAATDLALNDIMAERLDQMGFGSDAEGRQAVLAFMREDPLIREHVREYLEQILS